MKSRCYRAARPRNPLVRHSARRQHSHCTGERWNFSITGPPIQLPTQADISIKQRCSLAAFDIPQRRHAVLRTVYRHIGVVRIVQRHGFQYSAGRREEARTAVLRSNPSAAPVRFPLAQAMPSAHRRSVRHRQCPRNAVPRPFSQRTVRQIPSLHSGCAA